MNILIIPSWYTSYDNVTGNGGIFHYEQAKELSKEHNVAVFNMFDRKLPMDFLVEEERGILTFRSKFIPSQRLGNRIRIFKAFKRIVKEFQPDIVHTHVATEAGRYTALWCGFFKIPFVVTEHSTVEISGVDKGIAHLYAEFVYKRSKRNFCVSEDLKNKLSSIFPKYSFHVMYNGINMPQTISDSCIYRRENCNNIVFVAALYDKKIKGLQYLMPALQKLMQEKHSICFHIVGGGEYEEYFHNMAEELGIAQNVVFYGTCEKQKVYEIIQQMDFLVSASMVESFGCSIAEALLIGKPVLATRCGGPEGFVSEEVGILVEKESTQALYDGLLEMMKRKNDFCKQAIQKYAYSRFDNKVICGKYVDSYQKIVGERVL